MIDLQHDALMFSFPEVHREAKLTIDFERTLRIPDDGKDYPLPPGLGRFPTRLVDDFPDGVPQAWLDGFSIEKGIIRQFVAIPLGAGYTAEEQITGEAEFGGLQVIV